MDLVESVLPWLDFDLWKQMKEKEDDEQTENPYYAQQMANMKDGSWNTDPESFDDLTVSDSALKNLGDVPQSFNTDTFNGMPDMPEDYEEFLKNLPGGQVDSSDLDKE